MRNGCDRNVTFQISVENPARRELIPADARISDSSFVQEFVLKMKNGISGLREGGYAVEEEFAYKLGLSSHVFVVYTFSPSFIFALSRFILR